VAYSQSAVLFYRFSFSIYLVFSCVLFVFSNVLKTEVQLDLPNMCKNCTLLNKLHTNMDKCCHVNCLTDFLSLSISAGPMFNRKSRLYRLDQYFKTQKQTRICRGVKTHTRKMRHRNPWGTKIRMLGGGGNTVLLRHSTVPPPFSRVDFLLCKDDTALHNSTADPQNKTSSSRNV